MGLEGLKAVKGQLSRLFANAPGAMAAGIYQEGLRVDADAVSMCPVDSGRLRATHYVGPPEDNGSRIDVPVGFGTDYAVYVHENTSHRLGKGVEGPRMMTALAAKALHGGEGGTATGIVGPKFLERAMHNAMAGFEDRLARRVRRNIRDGITVAPIDASVPTSPQDPGPMEGPGRKQFGAQKRANRRADKRARKHHAKALKSLARKQKTTAKRERRKAATAAKREASKARKAEKRAEKRQQRAQKKLDRTRNRASPKRFDF
jgi:hypothetical protein